MDNTVGENMLKTRLNLKHLKNKMVWYIKQLLSLTYFTEFKQGEKKYVEI